MCIMTRIGHLIAEHGVNPDRAHGRYEVWFVKMGEEKEVKTLISFV